MRKKDYKKYTEPESITPEEEITSHSSLLVNRRLDIMFLRLDEIRVEAWDNICVPNLKTYFSVLSGIYDNIWPIFDIKENKKMKGYFDLYHQMFLSLFQDDSENIRVCSCGSTRLLDTSPGILVCLKCGSTMEDTFKQTKSNKYQICYDILFILDQIQKMMIGFLQKRQFFFKMGKPTIKGIDDALALYEKREHGDKGKAGKKL